MSQKKGVDLYDARNRKKIYGMKTSQKCLEKKEMKRERKEKETYRKT